MEKILFNHLSKQVRELVKTAQISLISFLSDKPNKTYQTDKIDTEKIIYTYDNETFAFVGCYLSTKEKNLSDMVNKGLKLLGYKIVNEEIVYKKLYEIELFDIDNVQLLNIIQYINEIEFSID